MYIGESSRSLHERSLEHVKDAKSFSKKSHFVKQWMSVHPEHPNPPPFKFKVTQQFKDCMSRQVAEAIRIQHTKDNILNSKCEYLQNCITRLTVNEEVWERKERERREEETEKEEADNLERFKREKLSIRQTEEAPRTGQKRKRGVACMEEERPRMVEDEQHERVGEGQQEHEQHPPKVQHQEERQEPLLTEDIMHGVSGDSSEPLLEMDRVQVEQQHHRCVEDDQDGQDGLHVRAG